jgi:hypothetical protein
MLERKVGKCVSSGVREFYDAGGEVPLVNVMLIDSIPDFPEDPSTPIPVVLIDFLIISREYV